MPKTKSELVAEAHRQLAVLSVDEEPSTDMTTYGESKADSLFAELLAEPHAMGFTWDLGTIPDAVFVPLAQLLAAELTNYQVAPPVSRVRAMGKVRAYAFTDDRDDRRDADDDGIITDDEETSGLQEQFY